MSKFTKLAAARRVHLLLADKKNLQNVLAHFPPAVATIALDMQKLLELRRQAEWLQDDTGIQSIDMSLEVMQETILAHFKTSFGIDLIEALKNAQ